VFPLAGAALGAAAGAAIGAAMDTGVSSRFIEELKTSLRPGRSALFVVVKEADADALVAGLRGFPGDVVQTSLSPDTEDALRRALGETDA